MTHYDAIIIGTGGVGSACCFHLAKQGVCVLGLDRFPAGHDRGSSHGQTRIIRKAYFEHPDYVPLVQRAYELWRELEHAAGQSLLTSTGLLEVGPPEGHVIPGIWQSVRQHQLLIEEIGPQEMSERFPGFVLPEGCTALFEPDAGILNVEQCVLAHLKLAERSGATLLSGVTVLSWKANQAGVHIETTAGTFSADHLVLTAGAWAGSLLNDLGISLRVMRKPQHWFANSDPRYRLDHHCPVFLYELGDCWFYGFPERDQSGVKVAAHHGGTLVEDPLTVQREVDDQERFAVINFIHNSLPGVSTDPIGHSVCLYTMSPDSHFIVDRHPHFPRVAFAAGLSGHGFKFTAVLGEILADLMVQGRTSHPIDFLSVNRPGLRPEAAES